MRILTKLHELFPRHIPIMTDWVWEEQKRIAKIRKEQRRIRRKEMFSKIADGIRSVIGAITGMAGYSIVWDATLAEDKAERDELYEKNAKLEREIAELKKRQATDFLADYEYAIMMSKEKTYPMIWNDGRWENRVRTVTFLSVPGSVPELTLKK